MDNPKLKYLEDVAWDNSLKLSNGKVVHGLEQLPMVIKFSDEEVFYTHITGEKNDFVNWIRDIIGDNELSEKIAVVHDRDEFLKVMDQGIIDIKNDIKNYKPPEQSIQQLVQQPTPVPSSVPASIAVAVPAPAFAPAPAPIPVSTPAPVIVPVSNPVIATALVAQPISPIESPVQAQSAIVQQPIQPQTQQSVVQQPIQSTPHENVNVSVPDVSISGVSSPDVTVPAEETFDFEEIFKVLITELEQNVLAWDTQTN